MHTPPPPDPTVLPRLLFGLAAPPGVAVSGADATTRPLPQVRPEEEALLHPRATTRRIADFRRGRHAAHLALDGLGAPDEPVLRGAHHEPRWPAGVAGSITHGAGIAIAAVARRSQYLAIGLDIEHRSRYFAGLAGQVLIAEEHDWLGSLSNDDRIRATLEIFSAKETIYKAFFPLVGDYFGFEAAHVLPGDDSGMLTALLHEPIHPQATSTSSVTVRRHWEGDLLVTAVFVPAP